MYTLPNRLTEELHGMSLPILVRSGATTCKAFVTNASHRGGMPSQDDSPQPIDKLRRWPLGSNIDEF